ncbi:MAG: hypothetical protein Q7S56_02820 [Nanoarchaeota archaeon]|nr:hypothetical protein [Nanoarchaeota archaeon]
MKKLVLFFILLLLLQNVYAGIGSSSNFNTSNKGDSGGVNNNATSASFTQRFFSGVGAVGQYIVSTLSGRFGVLGDTAVSLAINVTSPSNNSILVRGNESFTGEDDLGIISNFLNITANVYDVNTLLGYESATCYFYNEGVSIGSSSTNSSGDCFIQYNKSADSVGIRNFFVNFSSTSGNTSIENSSVNISLERYVTSLTMSNLQINGKYYNGDQAVLLISVRKSNASVTSQLYDPINISAAAMNSINAIRGIKYYPGNNITKLSTGQYSTNVTLVYGAGADSFVKWQVNLSDDGFVNYLGSALHSDEDICSADFGAFSDWSACSGGTQTRTRNDTSGCSEVQTQSCSSGGDSCFPAGTKITMADGSKKNIEDVKIGEYVKSYDLINDKIVYAKVLEIESPIREGYYDVGGILNVTDEHPIYVMKKDGRKGWGAVNVTKAKINLQKSTLSGQDLFSVEKGDKLFNEDGSWVEIKYLNYVKGEIQTYNLKQVDNYNVFFAASVLVHNKGETETCSNECSSGATQTTCLTDSNLGTRTCGNFDSDTCTEWGSWSSNSCSAGNVCSNAQCVQSTCTENWNCNSWGSCVNGIQTRACNDLNSCGTSNNKPLETKQCNIVPYVSIDGGECFPNWDCGDWGSCRGFYDLNDVLKNVNAVNGTQTKTCRDLTGCAYNETEARTCSLRVPIEARLTQWCYDDYVEIYEVSSGALVSRVKQSEIAFTNLSRIDITFTSSNFTGSCAYCFNGIKDYDETGVDCGGQYCGSCLSIYGVFDWAFWVVVGSWFSFGFFLIILWRREDEERKKEGKESLLESVAEEVESVQISSAREKEIEVEIAIFFRKILESRVSVEKPETKVGEKVVYVEPEVQIKRRRNILLEQLKRKLHEWKKEGYSGTTALEEKIRKLESKNKSFFSRVVSSYKERAVEAQRSERLEKEKEMRAEREEKRNEKEEMLKYERSRARSERELRLERAESERKWNEQKSSIKKWFGGLFVSSKKVSPTEKIKKIVVEKERPKIRVEEKHKVKSGFFARLFARSSERERLHKKLLIEKKVQEKNVRHIEKVKLKVEKKRIKSVQKERKRVEKERRKVIKKKISKVTREIRKRKFLDLMRKLRLWRKEGYYGTAVLEEEVKRLKRQL